MICTVDTRAQPKLERTLMPTATSPLQGVNLALYTARSGFSAQCTAQREAAAGSSPGGSPPSACERYSPVYTWCPARGSTTRPWAMLFS